MAYSPGTDEPYHSMRNSHGTGEKQQHMELTRCKYEKKGSQISKQN